MNWKKEGYEVGQEVFLVKVCAFSTRTSTDKGIVSHVGTKLLKIDCNSKIKLTFKDHNCCNGRIYGTIYYLYKTEEEYIKAKIKTERKNEFKNIIKNHLNDLSYEQLETIVQWIEGDKNNDKKRTEN